MNDHTLRVLEFDKIRGVVAGYAASAAGQDAVAGLVPATDAAAMACRLRETGECLSLLQNGEVPPLEGIRDIRQVVQKLRVGGSMLLPGELLDAALTLGAGRRLKQFFLQVGTDTAPRLCRRAEEIRQFKHIEDAVFAAIDDQAEVKDSASPALRKIRKQIGRTREDILGRMSGILQSSEFTKVIQEPVVTIRADRYVLPLKPNFRQSIKGVVHGQSGSRATLFVEPLEILEQNNRLAELRMEEREEVERILRELTQLIGQDADGVAATVAALTGIDVICAGARFGQEYGGTIPLLSADRTVRLRAVRHPLLAVKCRLEGGYKQVAPNDIELRGKDRALILSGPNAGGKTVVLKAMGLIALMAQAGLPVTAAEGCELPCFSSIFADIGDEQSLEQDLSTFSSHVSQIAGILRLADHGSLVLLDELGSGTDPNEGAGLGAAVLENLLERGCITLVTTHHNALKLFGAQTTGAVNAAMEFDPQTLKPTYRLIPGRPGRSYGLDMAMRLGVPEEVVRSARTRISEEGTRLEELLKRIEEDTLRLEAEKAALDGDRSHAQQARTEADALLQAAKDEARAVRAQAKTESREVIAALRQKLRELGRVAHDEPQVLKQAASDVEALVRKLATPEQEWGTAPGPVYTVRAGERVRLTQLNRIGTVISSTKHTLEIELDGKTIKLPAGQAVPLEPHERQAGAGSAPGWGAELHEHEGPQDRLNLLGLRVEEALAEVERFLDRADMASRSSVTVIHGLGTGALRRAVTDCLKNHPLIVSIRTGEPSEGGAGVTVAELKK